MRDLDADFEPYVPRAITTLVPLTRHASVEVIEAIFTTFASLFKYLHKPLAANPIPVFDAFAVLFGRESSQKPYILRFAAESLSFLLRRTRTQVQVDFLEHMFTELRTNHSIEFAEGLSMLLSETLKGVDHSLHIKGIGLFEALLGIVTSVNLFMQAESPEAVVIENITINILHHCTHGSFAPILDLYLALLRSSVPEQRDFGLRLCYISCAVRKATRIRDWHTLLQAFQLSIADPQDGKLWNAARLASVAYTYAPNEALLAKNTLVLHSLSCDQTAFLAFAEILAKQNISNFTDFVLTSYRKFVSDHWGSGGSPRLMRSLIVLSELGCFSRDCTSVLSGRLRMPNECVAGVLAKLECVTVSIETQASCRVLVQATGILTSDRHACSQGLTSFLKHCLEVRTSNEQVSSRLFALLIGDILTQLSQYDVVNTADYIQSLTAHTGLWTSSAFLKGFYMFHRTRKFDITPILTTLLNNLSGPGHLRRLYSLQLLQRLLNDLSETDRDLLSTCEIIESTDLTMDSTRSLAMHIRKINQQFSFSSSDSCKQAVVRFSMGLLTGNYTPFWDMCCETLSVAAKSEASLVWSLAKGWLDHSDFDLGRPEDVITQRYQPRRPREAQLDAFRCFNTAELQQNCLNSLDKLQNHIWADDISYADGIQAIDELHHVSRRLQALRIFCALPDLAASHSRDLVPVFLLQVGMHVDEEEEDLATDQVEDDADESDSTTVRGSAQLISDGPGELDTTAIYQPHDLKFSKKERNDLLKVFTKFQNPAALSQADAVYAVVMDLLASRDSRTQAMAFEIIMHYRDQVLIRYEDNLKNLLSDSRSRDEITTFLQVGADETIIQEDHRQHVIPVVARILYGKMINRRHVGSQKKGLSNSRNIILGAIASLSIPDIAEFVKLFLRSFKQLDFIEKSLPDFSLRDLQMVSGPSIRKQVGFCTMVFDAVRQLAGKMLPFISDVLDALLFCSVSADQTLNSEETDETRVVHKIARTIRHSVYQILDMLFTHCRSYHWTPYLDIIFRHFVLSRIDKLSIESSQNPSGLLKLLGNWGSSPVTSPLLLVRNGNTTILQKTFDCLAEKSVKAPVVIFILEMVQSLCDQEGDLSSDPEDQTPRTLVEHTVEAFLDRMTVLLENQQASSTNRTISADLLQLETKVLSSISVHVKGGRAIQKLLDLLMPLLQKPRKIVQEAVKEEILLIVERFLPLSEDIESNSDSLWLKFHAISSLFASCSSRSSRNSLTRIMSIFAGKDHSLNLVTSLVTDLNSYSLRRLDTPDFDRRLAAFAALNEEHHTSLGPKSWRPLIYNLIYFVGDDEELALRTNAAYGLRRFLEATNAAEEQVKAQHLKLLEADLYPAIKKGMRHRTENIRQEWVNLLGNVVKECAYWPQVQDLVPLLMGDDEEANFFYNIIHIQHHRRMRALRRLATISQDFIIQSNNVAQVLLPLIEHYCFMPKENSHNLIAETIKTIGQLSSSLKYNQYCALLNRYISLLKASDHSQPTIVRLIGVVVDALVGTPDIATTLVDYLHNQDDTMDQSTEEELDRDVEVSDIASVASKKQTELQSTRPDNTKVYRAITNAFLPPLSKYLHSTEDETVSLRIPIALTVVKLLSALPHESMTMRLPAILTDVCHILRSRSQDARDMTRKTLGTIATLLGPKYFSYILSELKAALQRGYQLHVLGFSVHTILVKLEPPYGSLDYCLPQLVDMLMGDIFGETGLEKEAEDYITKMKEMKSTKSYDSFEVLASSTTLPAIGELLWPLKTLVAETSSPKVLRKVDEVFRRLTLGILRNHGCSSRDCLLFCYNVYQDTVKSTEEKSQKSLSLQDQARKEAEKNFVVDLNHRKSFHRDHSKQNAHKLYKFALETLRAILQKHAHLQTPENLAAFIPLVGDSMMSGYEDVHISALRLMTSIIKVDLPSIDSGAAVFLEKAVGYVKSSPITNTELCQAAFKFISAILKERKSVKVKDSVLAYILIRIKADIEEPDRQGVTFSILRSIMSRKFMVPELYDIMDQVANMMVTNQSASPRETARSAYYQFLLSYPQGKGRLKQQITFLVKNLEYVHATGRQSVMEALNLIVTQFDDSILQEFLQTLFISCTMSLVNDDEAHCRELSAALLRKIIERSDQERLVTIISALKSWAYNEQDSLQRAAFQGFGLLFDVKDGRTDDMKFFIDKLTAVLAVSINELDSTSYEEEDEMESDSVSWEVLYYGLQTFSRVLLRSPAAFITAKYSALWKNIQKLLLYRHAWVRLSSARLIGTLFASRQTAAKSQLFILGKDLVWQDIDLVRIARHSLIQLRSPFLANELGTQIIKNLLFLLKVFNERSTVLPPREDIKLDDEQEEQETTTSNPSCVEWLVRRMSTLLQSDRDVKRETHILVRRLLLQFLAATINLLPPSSLITLSEVIARPLYKYSDLQSHTPAQSELKDLSTEILDLLKSKIGQTVFANAYNAVRQAQLATRQERKMKRTIEAVRDPEARAMKKAKSGVKKKEKRAEVARENKRRREMRGG